MGAFLTYAERAQLAVSSLYLGALKDGGNLDDRKYTQDPAVLSSDSADVAKKTDFFKKTRKKFKRNYWNLSYKPQDIPYLISTVAGKTNFGVLRKLKPFQLSFLVPRIKLFKVHTGVLSGESGEVEIPFHTRLSHSSENPGRDLLRGAGVKDFEAIFQGVNEAEVENNIRCRLKLFFSGIDVFSQRNEILGGDVGKIQQIALSNYLFQNGLNNMEPTDPNLTEEAKKVHKAAGVWRYVDLLTPPISSYGDDGTVPYWHDNYKIRVVFGWTVPDDLTGLGLSSGEIRDLKKTLERLNYSLTLNVLTHTFSITQEGLISLDVDYIGSVEQVSGNPHASIFRKKGNMELLSIQRNRLSTLEREADRVRAAEGPPPVEINEKIDKLRKKYYTELSNFGRDEFSLFFDRVLNVGANYTKPPSPYPDKQNLRWNLAEGDNVSRTAGGPGSWERGDIGLKNLKVGRGSDWEDAENQDRAERSVFATRTALFSRYIVNPKGESGADYTRSTERGKFIKSMKRLAGLQTPAGGTRAGNIFGGSGFAATPRDADRGGSNTTQVLIETYKEATTKVNLITGMVRANSAAQSQYTGAGAVAESGEIEISEERRQALRDLQSDIVDEGVKFEESQAIELGGFVRKGVHPRSVAHKVAPVSFVTIGDIIQAALMHSNPFHRSNKVILGTMMITRRAEKDTEGDESQAVDEFGDQGGLQVYHIPLEDIPITCHNFFKWFTKTIVSKQKYGYTVKDLLSKGIRELIAIAFRNLSYIGFRDVKPGSISQSQFSIPTELADQLFTARATGPGDNYIRLEQFRHILGKDLDNAGILSPNQTGVVYVGGKPPSTGLRLAGNLVEDEINGVKHFFIGADAGVLKSATFQKDDLPGYREAKIKQAQGTGIESQLAIISEPYLLTVRLVGNSLFYPGMRIYFHPTLMGSSGELVLPLEGYYLIYEVKDYLESGNFETELKCRYEAGALKGDLAEPIHKQFNDAKFFGVTEAS
jgi:hypothetical protein